MPRTVTRRRTDAAALPAWVAPQLTQLVETAPHGDQWLHEIKYDGYRMHARLDRGVVKLLTRTGLDWTHKNPTIAKAAAALDARQAISTANSAASVPTGSPRSTSSSSRRTSAKRRRWSSSCSIFSISTARICASAH
jgi:ATP-dependent DNA ligase